MNFSSDPINNLENLIAKNKTKSLSIYLVVILVIMAFMACLPIIKVDISSQSRGMIRAKQENVPSSTVVSGKITHWQLQNNKEVKKGDSLLIVARENLQTQKQLNDSLLSFNSRQLKDLRFALNNALDSISELVIKEQYQNFLTRKSELQSKISQARQNYNRYKKLYDKEVIAKQEYETYLYNLRFANEALQVYIKQQQTDWQTQIRNLEEQVETLKSKAIQLDTEKANYVLTAPISGTLEQVVGLQAGAFINATQIIGYISPNTSLIVENMVAPNDIGLLKVGQPVKFQLDAFNYNQWGMLEGQVIDIDKNISLEKNSSFFKVRCSLNSKTLTLKNGYSTQVAKGMTLTTRYFITRRSLFDLLFDKVDDWLNPKIITQNI